MKDKGTSDAVSKNRMHAAHEQSLEPSSTSDKDQEQNKRECKNQISSPQSCSNRSNPFGAVRERERAERRERRRESTRCGTFSCSLRSCECLDTRLSSAEGVSGTNRQTPASGNLTWGCRRVSYLMGSQLHAQRQSKRTCQLPQGNPGVLQ